LDARPTFDEVLAVRNERMQSVARFLAATNNGELTVTVASPNGGTTSVMSCIHVVMNEEWAHDRYANRDLDVLTAS
jgi:DinB family protein